MIWRVRYPRLSRGVILVRNSVALRSVHTVWKPLWAHAANETGMTFQSVLRVCLGHGKKFVQDLIGKKRVDKLFGNIEEQVAVNPKCHSIAGKSGAAGSSQASKKRYLVERLVRWCSNSAVADIRRNAVKKLAYGGKNAVPYLGFVGINLISGQGLVTKKDELDRLCEDIRCCVATDKNENPRFDPLAGITLDDLKIGEPIAKGCNAVVHAACWKPLHSELEERSNSDEESASTMQEVTMNKSMDLNSPVPTFKGFDLAVKIMFNYDAESNTYAILRTMHRETIPALSVLGVENITKMEITAKRPLPTHPNIVKMHCAFTDSTPFLPDAMQLYPDALPYRLNANGSGRNMTLFLVMKRYHSNLRDYLEYHTPSPTTRLLLLTQLLEAINHLTCNDVSHRDLKSDNVLLDLSTGLDSPIVAIADFGNAYVGANLRMPFTSPEIERGGNYALMAPEVKTANPGLFNIIDYSRSDLWTLGTLAYEIYGKENPFYLPAVRARLEREHYSIDDLPPFPKMPKPVMRLVSDILQQEPLNRPSPAVAANVCHLLMWGPRDLISTSKIDDSLSKKMLIEWLVTEAAVSLLENSSSPPDVLAMLRNTFLSRLHIHEVESALSYFL